MPIDIKALLALLGGGAGGQQEKPLGPDSGPALELLQQQQPPAPPMQPPQQQPMTGQQYGQQVGDVNAAIQKTIPPQAGQGKSLLDWLNTPMGAGGDKPRTPFSGWTLPDYALKTNPVLAVPTLLAEKAAEGGGGVGPKVDAALTGVLENKPVADIVGNVLSAQGKGSTAESGAVPTPFGTGAPGKSDFFNRLDQERGGTFEETHPGNFRDPMNMFASTAQEAVQRGINTPEKADEYLRMEFKDDPYLEGVIQEARDRYGAARADSASKPGIIEYLGYALAMLAGAHPLQAAEIISRRGEKMGNERAALQDLMGFQGMKARERMDTRHMASAEARQMEQARAMLQREDAKGQRIQQEKSQDMNFQRLKSGRGAALQQLNALRQQYPAPLKVPPEAKKQMDDLQKRVRFFNQQLGEPNDADITGMGPSPDVMRLLGMG